MGNTQADLKTSTPDSIKCKEELESIKHTLDNLDEIAEQNSNLNLTAEQLFTYKKQIDDIEEQLNSLTERHSISERSDMTNLYEKQVELFRHVYTLQKDVGDVIEATIHPPTVSIHDLKVNHLLNGRVGKRGIYSKRRGRYLVHFEDGVSKPLWIKAENMTVDEDLPIAHNVVYLGVGGENYEDYYKDGAPLRNGEEVAGGTDFPDSALGSAFDVGLGESERKDGQSRSTSAPRLLKQASVGSQRFHEGLQGIEQNIDIIETSVCEIFTNQSNGTSSKINELLRLQIQAKKLTEAVQDLNNELRIAERSQVNELRKFRKDLNTRIWASVDDITEKLNFLKK